MRKHATVAGAVAIALMLVGVSRALAQHAGGWHGGGEWHGGWGHWHGGWHGGWDHDWHGGWHGGVYWGFGFGPWWGPSWNPWWADPYAYYPFNDMYAYQYSYPVAPVAPPPVYWYYCRSKKAYYPYASSCPEAWERVPAQPPQ